MKNGKALGADGTSAELLQAKESLAPTILSKLFCEIWTSENISEDWKTGLIVTLAKKGDLLDCNNWRGKTLLSLTSKVFGKVILERLTATLEKDIGKEQVCFRKGRSCSVHIFTLKQILKHGKEWNSTVYANSAVLEKAFDSIHRETLWYILRHYGIPSRIVNIVRMLYRDCQAQAICGNKLTEPFIIQAEVKQGCILSPFLFSLGIY